MLVISYLAIIISLVLISDTIANPNIKYHIKWIHNDYALPIYLVKKIDTSIDADYKWYRHTDNLYVDEIENYEKYFLYSSTSDSTNLYIVNYNNTTHDQLASYEPRIIAVRTNSDDDSQPDVNLDELNTNREIFTLSYLKSQSILIDDKKDPNKIDYSCSVIILLPISEYQSDLKTEYNNLLQNYIYIKMVLTSDDDADLLNVKHNNPIKPKHKVTKREIDNKIVNFLEIEIREGPISVFKSFKGARRDNVSCYVKLTDSDDDLSRYEKTITKIWHKSYSHTTRFKAVYPTKKSPISLGNSLASFNTYFNMISLFSLIFIFTFNIY